MRAEKKKNCVALETSKDGNATLRSRKSTREENAKDSKTVIVISAWTEGKVRLRVNET